MVLTHFHLDHVGSAARLAECGVPVWALDADAAILRGTAAHPGYGDAGSGILAGLEQLVLGTPHLPAVRSLTPNSALFDSEWRIVAAPGHTPGSLALFDEASGDLISGDTLVAAFGFATGPHALFTPKLAQSQRSAELLLDLDPVRILPGHGPILPRKIPSPTSDVSLSVRLGNAPVRAKNCR